MSNDMAQKMDDQIEGSIRQQEIAMTEYSKETLNAARYRRLRHRIKHIQQMESSKMNFSPVLLEVYSTLVSYIAMLESDQSILRKPSEECKWTEDDANEWDTMCGECFVFNDGGPEANNFLFCPYCGKELKEIEYEVNHD